MQRVLEGMPTHMKSDPSVRVRLQEMCILMNTTRWKYTTLWWSDSIVSSLNQCYVFLCGPGLEICFQRTETLRHVAGWLVTARYKMILTSCTTKLFDIFLSSGIHKLICRNALEAMFFYLVHLFSILTEFDIIYSGWSFESFIVYSLLCLTVKCVKMDVLYFYAN